MDYYKQHKDNTMGLLNDVAKEQVKEPAQAQAPVVEAKKKHNNSEYQKKARERALKAAQTVSDFIHKNVKEIPQDVAEALDVLNRVRKPSGNSVAGQTSVFEKLFGAEPKVGTVIGAYEMLKKTGKGFGDMNKLIKKWAEKGTVVEFNEEKLEYKLVKLA